MKDIVILENIRKKKPLVSIVDIITPIKVPA